MHIQSASDIARFLQLAKVAGDSVGKASIQNAKAAKSAPVELPNIAPGQAAGQHLSAQQLKNAVDNINRSLQQSNISIQFSIDTDTQKTVVKLIDSGNGEVIRQYPSEDMLAISKSIENMQQGLLLKQRV